MLKQVKQETFSSWLRENQRTVYSLKIEKKTKNTYVIRSHESNVVYPTKSQTSLPEIDLLAQDEQNGKNALHSLFGVIYPVADKYPPLQLPIDGSTLTFEGTSYSIARRKGKMHEEEFILTQTQASSSKKSSGIKEKEGKKEETNLNALLDAFVKNYGQEKNNASSPEHSDDEESGSGESSGAESEDENSSSKSPNIENSSHSSIKNKKNTGKEKVTDTEIPIHPQAKSQFENILEKFPGKFPADEQTIQALTTQDVQGRTPASSLFASLSESDPLRQWKINYLCELLGAFQIKRGEEKGNEGEKEKKKEELLKLIFLRDKQGKSLLHYLCRYGTPAELNQFLTALFEDPESPSARKYIRAALMQRDHDGMTPLHEALVFSKKLAEQRLMQEWLIQERDEENLEIQKEVAVEKQNEKKQKEETKEKESIPSPFAMAHYILAKDYLTAEDLQSLDNGNRHNHKISYMVMDDKATNTLYKEKSKKPEDHPLKKDDSGKNRLHLLITPAQRSPQKNKRAQEKEKSPQIDLLSENIPDRAKIRLLMGQDDRQKTPLHYLFANFDEQNFNYLSQIIHGVKEKEILHELILIRDNRGQNILHYVFKGKEIKLNQFLDLFEDTQRTKKYIRTALLRRDNDGKTPLQYALAAHKYAIESSLKEKTLSLFETFRHFFFERKKEKEAISSPYIEIIKYFLANNYITEIDLRSSIDMNNVDSDIVFIINHAIKSVKNIKPSQSDFIIKTESGNQANSSSLSRSPSSSEIDSASANNDKPIVSASNNQLASIPQINEDKAGPSSLSPREIAPAFKEIYEYFKQRSSLKEIILKGRSDLDERIDDFITIINNVRLGKDDPETEKIFFKKEHRFFTGTERYQQLKMDFVDYVIALEYDEFKASLADFELFLQSQNTSIAEKLYSLLQQPIKQGLLYSPMN